MTQSDRKAGERDYERRAEILLEAFLSRDDRKTAKKHGITDRTIRAWRARLATDDAFAEVFRTKKARVSEGWADEVPGAMRASISFLRKAAEEGDPKDPAMVHSVAGAMKLLAEVSATWKLLDARLSRSTRPDGTADRSGSPSGPGTAAIASAHN